MYVDRELACRLCGTTFLFTAREQEFFVQKGLSNEPKHCPDCRLVNRVWRQRKSGQADITVTEVVCAQCGTITKVPFKPKGHKPVYCAGCLHAGNGTFTHDDAHHQLGSNHLEAT